MNPSLRRIQSIKVTNLFGLYDHVVDLKRKDRVTIIHGPNGVGKTVLLRMIRALFHGDYQLLMQTPFSTFSVTFEDGDYITMDRSGRKTGKRQRSPRDFRIDFRHNKKLKSEEFTLASHAREIAWGIEARFPWLRRLSDSDWLDLRTGEHVPHEILHRLGHISSQTYRREPPTLKELRESVGIHLIETQRLLHRSNREATSTQEPPSMAPTVREYARALKLQIKDTQAAYGRKAQMLDETFPQRLLKKKRTSRDLSLEDLRQRMEMLEQKQSHLKAIGLLDDSAPKTSMDDLDDLEDADRRVITLYVRDIEEKLSVLDDLANRVSLFLDKLNTKFRHKKLRISRDKGFEAMGDNGEILDLDSLSSGEQHELVLLYDLLFLVKPNTLVLIDEPELSLHVGWQKRFLSDLLQIVDIADFDALVATHSPFIVGDRPDLMIALADEADDVH